jgi:hypothetical protein
MTLGLYSFADIEMRFEFKKAVQRNAASSAFATLWRDRLGSRAARENLLAIVPVARAFPAAVVELGC